MQLITSSNLPVDANLRTIADDVLAKFKYAWAAVATEVEPGPSGRLDDLFRSYLNTRSDTERARVREASRKVLAEPLLRATNMGRYAAVNENDFRTEGSNGLASRVGQLAIQPQALQTSIRKFLDELKPQPAVVVVNPGQLPTPNQEPDQAPNIALDGDLISGLHYKKLWLTIHSVYCREVTSGPGSDEISMGGVRITPVGNTALINQFVVGTDFDEGETKNLNKVFASWNLETDSTGFPYLYPVVMVMAEKDDGGFYQFLKSLWEKVDDEVKSAVAGLIGVAIGAAIGSVVGAIAGFVVGVFIAWLLELFNNKDDIVAVLPLTMSLGACTKSYYEWAELITPKKYVFKFNGDGGRYDVTCSYKVTTQ